MPLFVLAVGIEYRGPAQHEWPLLPLAALYTHTNTRGAVTQVLHLSRTTSIHAVRAALHGLRVVPMVVDHQHAAFVKRFFMRDHERIGRAIKEGASKTMLSRNLRFDMFGIQNPAYRSDKGSDDTTDEEEITLFD